MNGKKRKLIKEGFKPKILRLRENQLKIYEGIYSSMTGIEAEIYIISGKLNVLQKGSPLQGPVVSTLSPIGDNTLQFDGVPGSWLIFEKSIFGKITGLVWSEPENDARFIKRKKKNKW